MECAESIKQTCRFETCRFGGSHMALYPRRRRGDQLLHRDGGLRQPVAPVLGDRRAAKRRLLRLAISLDGKSRTVQQQSAASNSYFVDLGAWRWRRSAVALSAHEGGRRLQLQDQGGHVQSYCWHVACSGFKLSQKYDWRATEPRLSRWCVCKRTTVKLS